ncbi:HipA domain-containing protein [Advenella sp. WQ 585]|uniref:HipA domain-containing protein n=1 Tax=Advenella mandrilli TaxID=2800330 RepID=A0ABS1EEL3_9BURK|nr:HipA domain-containing protein [Advenella mandrilli]MBK1780686.1 HipA domain-containing protein [Advenella mandrilli]
MTSKRHPYFHPPKEAAVFAHIAGGLNGKTNGFVPAGMLENLNADTPPTFTYGKRYIERKNAIEVDPRALPLINETGGIKRHVLPDLMEFGGIRDAAPDAWGRRVIENKLNVRTGVLPEIAYLLEAGSDRVGALDVRKTLQDTENTPLNQEVELNRLLEVADKIENNEPVPEHLFQYFNGLGSAGGARPKATVRDENGILWLAKFPSKGDRACNAVLEGGTLELARAIGLRVPPIKIQEVGDKRVLLIRRFDRYWAKPGFILEAGEESWNRDPDHLSSNIVLEEGRIPFCSALTLMGLSEHEARASSYDAISQAIRAHGAISFVARDVKEIFKRMVFNIFANNNDDHLRNHAFIYDVAAKGWRLSPLYDVLPMNVIAQERYLHLEIGEYGRVATLDNALSRWPAFYSCRKEAVKAIQTIWLFMREWMPYFENLNASELDMDYLKGAFRKLEDLASAELSKEIRNH